MQTGVEKNNCHLNYGAPPLLSIEKSCVVRRCTDFGVPLTDSDFVYIFKMEYGWNVWLKLSFSMYMYATKNLKSLLWSFLS